MVDSDLVRVDILKIKRKLYISYPEGSKERLDFLVASKLSELNYLQKLVDPATVQVVFEEYNRQLKNEVVNIILCLGLGFTFTFLIFGFHQLHSTNVWLSLYLVPALSGIGLSITHFFHLVDCWKEFKPFRHEYEVLKKRIESVMAEIKGLAK